MILRPVRTSQPQGPARIDWSNPITRGLFSAIDSSGIDYVLGSRGVLWNANPITTKFTRFGKAVDFQQNQLDFPTKDYAKVVSNSTHIVVVEKAPQSNWKVATIHYGSTLRYYGGAMSFLNGVSRANFDGNQWNGVATLGMVQRTNSYFDYALFINGGTLTTTGNTNGDMLDGFVATLGGSAIGDRTSTTWWDEAVHLSMRFNRSLSESEMRSITANPWQIFAPDAKSLWVPDTVSAGGGATVIPIGVQATGSVGTPSATGAARATPAGVSASSAVGAPVAVGGASIPATVLPAGVQATGAVGTVSATGAAVAQPAGVTASGAVGTPVAIAGTSIPATVLPAGVQASSAVGTPTVTAAAIAQPLGVAATAYVGSPTIATGVSGVAVAYPSGVATIGQVGTLIATGAAWTAAVGVQAVASVGTPTAYAGEIVIYVAGAQTRPSRLQNSNRPSRLQTGTRASR